MPICITQHLMVVGVLLDPGIIAAMENCKLTRSQILRVIAIVYDLTV